MSTAAVNANPLVSGNEFAERISKGLLALDGILYQQPTVQQHVRVANKIQGMWTALLLWSDLTMTPDGRKTGESLAEAYRTLEGDLKEMQSAAEGGEREGYGLVLDYLRGVGY